MADLSAFGKSAMLLKRLRHLGPGEAFGITDAEMSDMEVPANPLDRQTTPYLAEFFRSRMPFYCTVKQAMLSGDWTFYRPLRHP